MNVASFDVDPSRRRTASNARAETSNTVTSLNPRSKSRSTNNEVPAPTSMIAADLSLTISSINSTE